MENLNKQQQKKLLKIARETLESYLNNKTVPQYNIEDKALNQTLGVFVTLTKKGELRGCIGEFETQKPLYQVVQDKTIGAALHDPRFNPVNCGECKDLKIEISVLSPLKRITDWKKIQLGKHGVVIKRGFRSGTFLPQVAKESGWDLEAFLSNLCANKAGLEPEAYKDPQIEIYIFTCQIIKE